MELNLEKTRREKIRNQGLLRRTGSQRKDEDKKNKEVRSEKKGEKLKRNAIFLPLSQNNLRQKTDINDPKIYFLIFSFFFSY